MKNPFLQKNETIVKERNGVNTIASNTFVLFIRMLFMTLINLYTVRCVLNGLGVVDYGILNAVAGIVTAGTCLSSVLALSTQRFYSYAIGKGQTERLKEIFSVSINLVVVLSIVLFIITITLGLLFVRTQLSIPTDRLSAAQWLLASSLFSFIFSILSIPYMGALFAHEDMKSYTLISLADCILKLIIAINLQNTSFDRLMFYGLGFAAISLFDLLAYVFITKKKYSECQYIKVKSKDTMRELVTFSGWTFYGTLAAVGMTQGSTILLNVFFGPIVNAAFNIGNQVYNALNSLSNSLVFAFRPPMIKAYSGKNNIYLDKLFSINNRVLINLLICISIPLLLETKSILTLWLENITEDMVTFTQLYIIYQIIIALHNPITIIIQASGDIKYYSIIVESITILCLPVSYILFKIGFPAQCLFHTMIAICFIAHIARLLILKKKYPTFKISDYLLKSIIPAIVTFSFVYGFLLYFHIHIEYTMLKLIVICITSPILTFLIACFINTSHEEKKYIYNFIKKRI